jgi:hypothetical protein
MMEDVYLGDGVYASFDGFNIWLDTRAQLPEHRIALEPATYEALVSYVAYLQQKAEDRVKAKLEEKSLDQTLGSALHLSGYR